MKPVLVKMETSPILSFPAPEGPAVPGDSGSGIPRWKRLLDVTLVLLLLPVILPVALAVAGLIRLVSRGPILFKQERIGYRGATFMCLKFRTMVVGADAAHHQGHLQDLMTTNAPMVKLDARGDSRIIPFGVLVRAAGLDELPQLLNVLRGEMSLVGPRPCLSYEFAKYLPWQRERFNTPPGLTGLWQVSGKNRTTFSEMMHLDINYVRQKTLWLDLVILARTLPAVLIQIWDTKFRRPVAVQPRRELPQPALHKSAILPPAV